MKTLISFLVTITLMLTGCENSETESNNSNNTNNNNIIVDYDHTECKNGEKKSLTDFDFSGFECIYYNYDGSGNLEMSHINAIFNCCPDDTLGLTGDVTVSGTSIGIVESDNGGNCNCMCPYDLHYDISNLPSGNYMITFNSFEEVVDIDLSGAIEGVICVDRLNEPFGCLQGGQRGCNCQDSTECMGGDGYCYGFSEFSNVCVNSCETTEDCPMPDLEECLEDESGEWYCSPVSSFDTF
ncbi:hypothetical protein KKF34_06000 [Myxococcota bacterium]|nr:hypothetical protein [Myxococcota bacterium]MBU1381746.1 hypothetical protein [Myxococcota bacterium]MBU1496414.1 hypothetical protein [Myxococcota bacterium]